MWSERPRCTGTVASVRGHHVLLTGHVRRHGERVFRPEWKAQLETHGATAAADQSKSVSLCVFGELHPDVVADSRGYSRRLVFAERERLRGHHVCVVAGDDLEALLHGLPAECVNLRLADDGATAYVLQPR